MTGPHGRRTGTGEWGPGHGGEAQGGEKTRGRGWTYVRA
jgi:hypothetical protein